MFAEVFVISGITDPPVGGTQCEWNIMTIDRTTEPDCAVIGNLTNTHTHTHTHTHTGPDCAVEVQFNKYTRTHANRLRVTTSYRDDRAGLRGYVQFNI